MSQLLKTVVMEVRGTARPRPAGGPTAQLISRPLYFSPAQKIQCFGNFPPGPLTTENTEATEKKSFSFSFSIFPLHPSSFILHNSSFILSRPWRDVLVCACKSAPKLLRPRLAELYIS